MPRKPIELTPQVVERAFIREMRAFFAEPNGIIAALISSSGRGRPVTFSA